MGLQLRHKTDKSKYIENKLAFFISSSVLICKDIGFRYNHLITLVRKIKGLLSSEIRHKLYITVISQTLLSLVQPFASYGFICTNFHAQMKNAILPSYFKHNALGSQISGHIGVSTNHASKFIQKVCEYKVFKTAPDNTPVQNSSTRF